MTRPKPALLQVWRSKRFDHNKTCLHIRTIRQNGQLICDRYVDGMLQPHEHYLKRAALLSGYWLISHHWSGENTDLIKSETIEELRGY